MRPVDRGGFLFASILAVIVGFVFLFPIANRTEAVRCPDGTGCLQHQYRSLFITAFVLANVEGPLDHLNAFTITLGLLGTAGAAAGAYRISSSGRGSPTR